MIKSHLNLCQCGSLERRHFRRCGIGAAMLALVFQRHRARGIAGSRSQYRHRQGEDRSRGDAARHDAWSRIDGRSVRDCCSDVVGNRLCRRRGQVRVLHG